MPPVTPSRMRATAPLCPRRRPARRPRREGSSLAVVVLDLALGDLLQGHGQVVLRARLDERRRGLFEAHALAELVVVVVDLPRALGGDDHERVARVDPTVVGVEQFVDAWMDHGRAMVPARCELPFDEGREGLGRPLDVVVPDHVAEAVGLLELLARDRDPLADLARALGRAGAQPALELGHVGGDEERDARARPPPARAARPRSRARARRPGPSPAIRSISERERAVAAADERRRARGSRRPRSRVDELLLAQEPVLAAVLLARPLRPRRRGDGDLELGHALDAAA